jgi:SRSO17 transposase
VHASPAELPELKEVLGAFWLRFRRPEGAAALERYLTGRLAELPNKNGEPFAQAVPSTSEQRLQECLTNRPWDEEDLHRQRGQKRLAEATLGDGVLVLDDTGFPKQGKASVGVARQDSGTLGKVGHGQIAVTCGDTAPQAPWPGGVRWSRPQAWAADLARRSPGRVPAEVAFQTKPEIALTRRDQARAWGVPHRCVGADADDGDNPHCLAGLEARQERDVGGVRAGVWVSHQRKARSPVPRVDQRLLARPRWPWRTIRWRHGTPGWRRKQFVAGRCWRITGDGQRHVGWLLGERATRGQPEERKYSWSHLPAAAILEELAGDAPRREAVAPCHAEAKGEVGWDQDQGRLWPGVHRQAVTVMLADRFLVWLERRRRRRPSGQGRPRDPCSPASGPTAADTAGDPSGGRPVAPPPSRAVVADNRSVHRTLLTKGFTKQY